MILIIALEKDVNGEPMIGGIYSNNAGEIKCFARSFVLPPEPVGVITSLCDFREAASGVKVYSVSAWETMNWRLHDQSLCEHLVDLALKAAVDEGFVTDLDVPRSASSLNITITTATWSLPNEDHRLRPYERL